MLLYGGDTLIERQTQTVMSTTYLYIEKCDCRTEKKNNDYFSIIQYEFVKTVCTMDRKNNRY